MEVQEQKETPKRVFHEEGSLRVITFVTCVMWGLDFTAARLITTGEWIMMAILGALVFCETLLYSSGMEGVIKVRVRHGWKRNLTKWFYLFQGVALIYIAATCLHNALSLMCSLVGVFTVLIAAAAIMGDDDRPSHA